LQARSMADIEACNCRHSHRISFRKIMEQVKTQG
jgi:hypothetical protein